MGFYATTKTDPAGKEDDAYTYTTYATVHFLHISRVCASIIAPAYELVRYAHVVQSTTECHYNYTNMKEGMPHEAQQSREIKLRFVTRSELLVLISSCTV